MTELYFNEWLNIKSFGRLKSVSLFRLARSVELTCRHHWHIQSLYR